MAIVSTTSYYNSYSLHKDLNLLLRTYPFLNVQIVGNSILGSSIYVVKLGKGPKKVFYSASIHANEWITSVILMKFIEDYASSYASNGSILNYSIQELFNNISIYIMPMVNPDGVGFIFTDILTKKLNCWHLFKVNSLIAKLYNHRHKIEDFDCDLLC